MKAMLLAAGLGTRLKPYTVSLPKCMVPVAGKPTLQRNVEWLRGQGITDVAVNLHYHPEAVTGYFQDGAAFGVRMHYSFERELLGTAGALLGVRDWLGDERFVVVFADNVINCDLEKLVAAHEHQQAAMTIALLWRDDVSSSGVATLGPQGQVLEFREKPQPDKVSSHWVNAGLLLCERRVLGFVPPQPPSDFGRDVFPALLLAGEPVIGYRMLGPGETALWIDTPDDLTRSAAMLSESESWQ